MKYKNTIFTILWHLIDRGARVVEEEEDLSICKNFFSFVSRLNISLISPVDATPTSTFNAGKQKQPTTVFSAVHYYMYIYMYIGRADSDDELSEY